MKIGEYLIKEQHITKDVLNEALALQERDKNMLLGEILVKMKKISREALDKYIEDYFNILKESVINDSSQWLNQDDVDRLSSQYFKPETK